MNWQSCHAALALSVCVCVCIFKRQREAQTAVIFLKEENETGRNLERKPIQLAELLQLPVNKNNANNGSIFLSKM